MNKFIQSLDELDNIVKNYHARNGTYNFHYSGCALHQWTVDVYNIFPRDIADSIDVQDWIVNIYHSDNSNSTDSYYVPLKTILDWYDAKKESI